MRTPAFPDGLGRFCLFVLLVNAAATMSFAALNVDVSIIGAALSADTFLLPDVYVIGVMCVIPLTPTLLASWGPRRLFIACMLGLMATSGAAALTQHGMGLGTLLFLHGAFVAPVVPTTQTLCATRVEDPALRRRLLAYWMATTIAGVLVAYSMGAWVAQHLTWRLAFLGCWAPALLALALVGTVDFRRGPTASAPFDIISAVLLGAIMLSITGLLVFVSHLGRHRVEAVSELGAFLLAAVVWLMMRYRRAAHPILDFSVMHDRWLAGAVLATLVLDVSSTGVFQTQLLAAVLKVKPEWLALRSSLAGLAMLASVAAADRLMHWTGRAVACSCAIVLLVCGKIGFLTYGPGLSRLQMLWPALLAGAGYGMSSTILATTACHDADERRSASAATLYAVAVQMGSSIGLAGLDAVLEIRERVLLHQGGHADPAAAAFFEIFCVELALGVLLLPIVWLWFGHGSPPHAQERAAVT